MEDKDYETKVTIDKGLKPESGNNSTAGANYFFLVYSFSLCAYDPEIGVRA